tara:strand:+ start:12700 stop:12999 length:300 start_codon:yes stop_codon:yes gene_type:complete
MFTNKGQDILEHRLKIFWQTKRGKSFLNHTRGSEERPIKVLTRAKVLIDINKSSKTIEYIRKISHIPKSAVNVRATKIFSTKKISESAWYKEKDYDNEF